VQDWLKAHSRWPLPVHPGHTSWLNQIEIFFAILSRRLLTHGIFTSQDDLAQPCPPKPSLPQRARGSGDADRAKRRCALLVGVD